MWTKDHRPSRVDLSARTPWGPTAGLMAIGFAVSWVTMLGHNLFELPLTPLDVGNSGPLLVDLALLITYWRRPASPGVPLAILGWAVLNLLIGGVVTVLPWAGLPFVPEQTLGHYLAHVVYAVGQVPLVLLAVAALRQRSHETVAA